MRGGIGGRPNWVDTHHERGGAQPTKVPQRRSLDGWKIKAKSILQFCIRTVLVVVLWTAIIVVPYSAVNL